MAEIRLIIDGQEATVPQGATILDAAQKLGSYVPALCDHPDLKPIGSCKLCIVSVEGLDYYPTSCNTLAEEGMVVETRTEELQEMRRTTLEMLLALTNHPTSCLFCDRKDECTDLHECMRKFPVTVGCKFCPNFHRLQGSGDVRENEERLADGVVLGAEEAIGPLAEADGSVLLFGKREPSGIGADPLDGKAGRLDGSCGPAEHLPREGETGDSVVAPGELDGVPSRLAPDVEDRAAGRRTTRALPPPLTRPLTSISASSASGAVVG